MKGGKRECYRRREKDGPITIPTSLATLLKKSKCTVTTSKLMLKKTLKMNILKRKWTKGRLPRLEN
jgi:hypothetical protein